MNRTLRHILMIAGCVSLLAACGKGADAPADKSSTASDEAEAIGIELDADQQAKLGVTIAPLAATEYQDEITGQGAVVDVQSIAQAIADLTTAEAAATASSAALERAQGLYKADTAISREALEAAKRQAVSDQANLALARTKASIAFGPGAPWLKANRAGEIMKRLASGTAVVFHAAFPSGLDGTEPSALTIRKIGGALDGPSWTTADVWAGPADSTVPGPNLFGYVENAKGLSSGDHVTAAIAAGAKQAGVIIPNSAIVIAGGQAWCYAVMDGNRFVREPIDLGHPASGGYFEPSGAANGFKPGGKVVIAGAGLLLARETGGGEEED